MKELEFYKNKSNLLRYELFQKMVSMQQGHPGSIFSIIDFLTIIVLVAIEVFLINFSKVKTFSGLISFKLYSFFSDLNGR